MHNYLEQLKSIARQQRLHHAWILAGRQKNTKACAIDFAKFLLCSTSLNNKPCNNCRGCNLFTAGTSPDYFLLDPDDSKSKAKTKSISVDQIRQTIGNLQSIPQIGKYKVLIITAADNLSIAAQNAFLKTLEEPGLNTVIILLAESTKSLLPTVLSRCQILPFYDSNLVLDWTNLSTEALLVLRGMQANWLSRQAPITKVIKKWSEYDLINIINLALLVLQKAIELQLSSITKAVFPKELHNISKYVPITCLFNLSDQLTDFKIKLRDCKQLNIELFLANWLASGQSMIKI